MNGSTSDQFHMEPALHVDRVEWLSSSTEAVVVRVFGRWVRDVPRPSAYVLLVDDDGERRAFASLPAPAGPSAGEDPGGWSVAFSVPIELRPRLEQGLVLALDGEEIPLPPALAGAAAPALASAPPAQVIDRAVLAERRARRAEINEQALMRGLAEADSRVTTLESQLANLEARLQQAGAERERLAAAAQERERDLRGAKQREYAEQQQRLESEEGLRRLEKESQAQLDHARRRLAEAEAEVRELADQQEGLRRELAEAQHALAADQARLRRAQAEVEQRTGQVARREAALAASGEELRDRVRDLEAQVAALEAQLHQARSETAGGGGGGTGSTWSPEVRAELELLREELDQAREAAREHAARAHTTQRMLDELGEALREMRAAPGEAGAGAAAEAGQLADLRDQLEAARREARERAAHEAELERMVAQLTESSMALRTAFEGELAALRAQLADRGEGGGLENMERRLEQVRRDLAETAATLQAELAAEREARTRAEQELDAERDARRSLEAELAAARAAVGSGTAARAEKAAEPADVPEADQRLRAELLALERELSDLRDRLAGLPEGGSTAAGDPPPGPASAPGAAWAPGAAPAPEAALATEAAPATEAAQEPLSTVAQPATPPPSAPAPAASPSAAEMAEALARAVERLRAGAAAQPEGRDERADLAPAIGEAAASDSTEAPPPVSEPAVLEPLPQAALPEPSLPGQVSPRGARAGADPRRPPPWLSRAIAALAARPEGDLGADLLLELIAVQGLRVTRRLAYSLEIAGRPASRVTLDPGRPAVIEPLAAGAPPRDLTLGGSVASLAVLAGGGTGLRLTGVQRTGSRRDGRHLRRAMRRPVTLSELVRAGVGVWPGLLLAAIAHEVAPAWTTGHDFTLAVVVVASPDVRLHVIARSGQALEVSAQPALVSPAATLRGDESALLALLAGTGAGPGTGVAMTGDPAPVEAFLSWVDRVQGRAG